MLEEQGRADGVYRKLPGHGGGVDRSQRLFGTYRVDRQRACGVEDKVEMPELSRQSRRHIGDHCLVRDVHAVLASSRHGYGGLTSRVGFYAGPNGSTNAAGCAEDERAVSTFE